jgi:hypothetical protein
VSFLRQQPGSAAILVRREHGQRRSGVSRRVRLWRRMRLRPLTQTPDATHPGDPLAGSYTAATGGREHRMAETISIDGQQYLKRSPLGVLGLMLITLGIYFFVWYYKINDELRRFKHDDTISPTRSLMAMIFGWLIIVPPFIAMYNTAKHLKGAEESVGVMQQVEPALVIVIMLVFSLANGIYVQEHLNRVWDNAASTPPPVPGGSLPPMPPAPPA